MEYLLFSPVDDIRSNSAPKTDDLLFFTSNFWTANGLVTEELLGLIASPKLYLLWLVKAGWGLTITLSSSFLSLTVIDLLTDGILTDKAIASLELAVLLCFNTVFFFSLLVSNPLYEYFLFVIRFYISSVTKA